MRHAMMMMREGMRRGRMRMMTRTRRRARTGAMPQHGATRQPQNGNGGSGAEEDDDDVAEVSWDEYAWENERHGRRWKRKVRRGRGMRMRHARLSIERSFAPSVSAQSRPCSIEKHHFAALGGGWAPAQTPRATRGGWEVAD
eukprot:4849639-Pyramimonas_sp.AAC.1